MIIYVLLIYIEKMESYLYLYTANIIFFISILNDNPITEQEFEDINGEKASYYNSMCNDFMKKDKKQILDFCRCLRFVIEFAYKIE